MSAVSDDYVLLNGIRFHFRDWASDGAMPLVLLHGYTGHSRSWDTLAKAMAPKYRVLALDQRGHGESGWASDYTPEAMVSDVAAFVGALRLDRFALLGLSMGGRNAYHYAGSRPAGLERLVIVDIGPDIVAAGSQRIRSGVTVNDVFESPEHAINAARKGNPSADETELRDRVRQNLMLREDGAWTFRYDPSLRNPETPLPRPTSEAGWAAVANINVPTLLVRGALSDVLSVETANRMVQAIPDCSFAEVPDAGHSIPLDNPAGLIRAVQTFL
ncbi:MAG: alpha/beta fold hydrolase [Dehalococcoidia bacterium]